MSDITDYTTLITSQDLVPEKSPAEIAVYKNARFRKGEINGKKYVDITFSDEHGHMGWVARVDEVSFSAIAAAFQAPDNRGVQALLDALNSLTHP